MTGPFGLYMGMPLEELSDTEDLGSAKYRLDVVPKPHPSFDYYVVRVTPTFGLSWIKAVGNDIPTSAHGIQLQTAFEDLEQRLTTVYGRGKHTDFLFQDSTWDGLNEWMMSLERQERLFWTQWSKEVGSTMKDSLAMVGLHAQATDSLTGWLAVEYSFENSDAADLEMQALEDEAL